MVPSDAIIFLPTKEQGPEAKGSGQLSQLDTLDGCLRPTKPWANTQCIPWDAALGHSHPCHQGHSWTLLHAYILLSGGGSFMF